VSANYRPRDGARRARGIVERQFREFDDLEDLDAELDEEFEEEPELPEWRQRVADRAPAGVRLAVGSRAAVAVLVVGVLVAAGLGFFAWRSWPRAEAPAAQPVPARTEAVAVGSSPASEPTSVVVHVAGRVAAPGVVMLPAGSRVSDALTAVGGPTADANLDAVNLARMLVDGEQVLVPGPGEVAPAGSSSSSSSGTGLVNLNSASAQELDGLPGVGEVLAGRIVAWREENGMFGSVDDLGEVQGIGPKVLENLRELVTV